MIPEFRAWDKKEKEMYRIFGFNTMKKEIYIYSKPYSTFKNHPVHTIHAVTRPLNDFILMQFTGVEDKNEVHIFEGDIVRISDEHDIYTTFAVVKWYGTIYPAFDLDGYDGCEMNGFSAIEASDDTIEVIGNIYENPELLTNES